MVIFKLKLKKYLMKIYKLYIEDTNKTTYYELLNEALNAYDTAKSKLFEEYKNNIISIHDYSDYPFKEVGDIKTVSVTIDNSICSDISIESSQIQLLIQEINNNTELQNNIK